MIRSIFPVFLIFFLFTHPVIAGKMRIAILDFQPKDISQSVATKVSELIRNEIVNVGGFTVVERAQMGEILKEQGLQQSGCTDTSCAVEVGKLLSARKMLVGTVMKLGSKIIITGRVIDVEKGTATFSEKGMADDEDDLYNAVSIFTQKLSEKIKAKKTKLKPSTTIESEKITITNKYSINASFHYMTGFGEFKKISDTGMGGSITFLINTFSVVCLGLNTGFYYFNSDKDVIADKFTAVPFIVVVGFRFHLSNNIFLMPEISAGGIYGTLTYEDEITKKKESNSAVQNVLNGGLSVGFILNSGVFFQVSVGYNALKEDDGIMSFLSNSFALGIRF